MTPASTASTTLLKQFGLTTAAEELVPRLTQAGHHDALPVLVEVLEAEAEARRQRRIARLRRASRLPPGKTFATLLAERRDARRRRDYHALRGRCGVAPVTRRAGKSLLVVRLLTAHHHLRDAAYH